MPPPPMDMEKAVLPLIVLPLIFGGGSPLHCMPPPYLAVLPVIMLPVIVLPLIVCEKYSEHMPPPREAVLPLMVLLLIVGDEE